MASAQLSLLDPLPIPLPTHGDVWFVTTKRRLLGWARASKTFRDTSRNPAAFHDWLDVDWLRDNTAADVDVRVVAWTEGGDETTRVVRVELETLDGRTGGKWLTVPTDLVYKARLAAIGVQLPENS